MTGFDRSPNPRQPQQGLFPLGRTVCTPGVLQLIQAGIVNPNELFERHLRGDWGDLVDSDWKANDQAVLDGGRIFSSYDFGNDLTVWVITESNRSATTILLPGDY